MERMQQGKTHGGEMSLAIGVGSLKLKSNYKQMSSFKYFEYSLCQKVFQPKKYFNGI